MPLFVTSTSNQLLHGVFAIQNPPPATIVGTGTGQPCIVETFPWGPAEVLTSPSSMAGLYNQFAPRGFNRTGPGHLAMIRKAWPLVPKVVRVLGSAAATPTIVVNKTGPTALITITLLYPGTDGNSVTATTSAASDGNSNHFNLAVTITGASGTTTELYTNLNVSGSGADVLPTAAQLAQSLLVASVTKNSTGLPIIGVSTASGGTNGTIDATRYVGTPGANDAGFALLEGDETIDFFFTGDPGNSLRATVNAGGVAHAVLTTDRCFVTNGPTGQTPSLAQTDVANYRAQGVVYVDPWVNINDDTTGAIQLVSPASFVASIGCQLPPSTSVAWKAQVVRSMLLGIVSLEANRGPARGTNTSLGIATLFAHKKGGFAVEAGKLTDLTAGQTNLTRFRMGVYIARSIANSLAEMVDAPNVPLNQQDVVTAVENFMLTLVANAKQNPNFTPHVLAFDIPDLASVNTPTTLAAGDFFIPLDVQTSSAMERIWLSIQFGETVTVIANQT